MKNNMTLEKKLNEMIPSDWLAMDVTAFELIHDGESWSVNTPFRIASNVDRESAISILRSRWEIFKVNYLRNARVKNISDISSVENECSFEVDCTAFADVKAVE